MLTLLGWFVATDLWADAEQSFKKGLEASDQQDWPEAAEFFRQAVAEDGLESSRRVFISGVFSSPYLPHFYLGWSLYRQGPPFCSEALKSWRASAQQGVVQTFRRQYQDLQSGRETCLEQLLPPAMSGAEAVLRRSRGRLQELVDGDVVDAAFSQDVVESIERLEERLAEAMTSKDLEAVRRVTGQAEEVAQDLERQQAAASARSGRRLEDATVDARRALNDADGAERQLLALLADPSYAAVRRTLPEEGVPPPLEARLRDVRALASRASLLDEHLAVETEARAVAVALEVARLRLRDLFDTELRRRAAVPPPEISASTAEVSSSLPVPSQDLTPPRTVPAAGVETSENVAQDPLHVQTRELLAWVTDASPTPLMTLQAGRLRGLLDGLAEGTGSQKRLEASLGAMQLLAAGHAFLRGEPRQTLRWIDWRPLPDSGLAAHGHLFAAAARFDLFRRGGEREVDSLEAARRNVLQCHRLDPGLEPDNSVFSPAFRSFYREVQAEPPP